MAFEHVSRLLLTAFNDNRFFETISDELGGKYEERSNLAEVLVRLHNDGDLDLVKEYQSLERKTDRHSDFFLFRDLFCKALPKLEAPVKQVMDCVLRLFELAGNDMTNGMVFSPYSKYCEGQKDRPEESLNLIEASAEQYALFLTPSIVAGSNIDLTTYVNKTINFTEHEDINIRRGSIRALGAIKYEANTTIIENVIETINHSCSQEKDDQLLGNLVQTAVNLHKYCTIKNKDICQIIDNALSKGDVFSLYISSTILGYQHEDLTDSMITLFLKHLQHADLKHKGIIDALDAGLSWMLSNDRMQWQSVEFMERYIIARRSSEIAELFNGTTSALLKNTNLFSRVITDWLSSGESALGEAILYMLQTVHGTALELLVDKSVLSDKDPSHIIFLARKIVGYLFFIPVTATSLLLSLLSCTKDASTTEHLKNLLYDPLLLNYPGNVKKYLEKQKSEQPEKNVEVINQILAQLESYFEDLHSPGRVLELQPYQSHREAYRRQQIRINAEISNEADKKSIFASLCSKVVLLYGNKSINYIYDQNGSSHRSVMPLQHLSTSIEVPFTERFDPFGLDYSLRRFRVERLKQ